MVAILAVSMNACYSVKNVPTIEFADTDPIIVGVVYRSGKVVEFQTVVEAVEQSGSSRSRPEHATKRVGARLVLDTSSIDGITKAGEAVSIPVQEVAFVQVKHVSTTKTVLLVVGVAAVIYATILLTTFDMSENVTITSE